MPSIGARTFSWRVGCVDLDGKWGWERVKIKLLFSAIIPKLQHYATMNWGSVEGADSHFVSFDQLCDAAQTRLVELRKEDISELFSLRMAGKKRIWGHRDLACLNLLWWDPNHEVCPSSKKHT